VWEIRAFVGRDPVTGKPRQLSKTVYGSAKAARSWVDSRVRSRLKKVLEVPKIVT